MEDEAWTSGFSIPSKFNFFDNPYRSADYDVDYEEIDVDEDYEPDYPCPFCSDDFDIVGLCCHIEEEHAVEAKMGVCPMCGSSVGLDMVEHVVLEHENINQSHTRNKLTRGESQSILSLIRKELQDKNQRTVLRSSSSTVSSHGAAIDALLTSFICSFPERPEAESSVPDSLTNTCIKEEPSAETVSESSKGDSSKQDEKLEEKTLRCSFVQSLVFSTLMDDGL